MEDIYQTQNASAVLRSADCFGIQDVHVIEIRNKYSVNKDVARGAPKWITSHKYINGKDNTADCYKALKDKGYRIVATSPHAKGYTIHNLPVEQKTALVFGTEKFGLSEYAFNNADDYVAIPIYGFTESFNISVTAALFMQHLIGKIRASGVNWQLPEEERLDILLQWAWNSVHKPLLLEKYFKSSLLKS
ncbi:MAG: RNA methyltransferase [Sphingobacteriales bacterium JAD_PAG50586_3]|nr:MAG: RNA methyltransferase [Sphingobacteriales bacterium JAD_PAG50586_3]